jgi:uncharacterized membrane protein
MAHLVVSFITVAAFYGVRLLVLMLLERSNFGQHMYYKATLISAALLFFIGYRIFPVSLIALVGVTIYFLVKTYRNGYE